MDTGVDRYEAERMIEDRALRLESYVDRGLSELRAELARELDELREALRSLERMVNARTEHLA